jgi:hypothetical protein
MKRYKSIQESFHPWSYLKLNKIINDIQASKNYARKLFGKNNYGGLNDIAYAIYLGEVPRENYVFKISEIDEYINSMIELNKDLHL